MRFDLRILLSFTLAIAAVPIVATALTFFLHESSEWREVGVAMGAVYDTHLLNSEGSTYIRNEDALNPSMRTYLRLRQIFRAPAINSRQIAVELEALENESENISTRQLPLNDEWQDVAPGVQVRSRELRVQISGKRVVYPTLYVSSVRVSVHPEYIFFPAQSFPPSAVAVKRTDNEPYVLSTVYDGHFYRVSTLAAGAFFFKTLLILSVTVLIAFLWALRRFSLRKLPSEISKNELTNVVT